MANQHFRTALNGFNKQDVVRYIEYLNNQHNAQVAQLKNQLRNTQSVADEQLQAKLDAALARCAELEAKLAEVPTAPAAPIAPAAPTDQELEAYRRAEQAERLAMERAQQIYTQANAILADATVKAESAVDGISVLAAQAKAQLQAYLDAISSTQAMFQDAVTALYAIKPENED